jgi:DNA-binding SARP family transcriptional activator/CheY-like chemotaxis protein
VLAYLAVEHRRAVTRDELANALWPEALPDSWSAALRGVVSDVRRFLRDGGLDPDELLATERGGYRLRLGTGLAVDIDDARDSVAHARRAMSAGESRAAAMAAERAASLAALPFLPEHEGEWVERVREELAAIRAEALELLAGLLGDAGDHRGAVRAAERLLEAEPYSDAAHRLRIETLAAAGDRAGALRAYDECRRLLRDELGLDPSAETRAVVDAILSADSPERHPSTAPSADSVRPRVAARSALVVEDHDFQRRTASLLLGSLGIAEVAEAPDGATALELLAAASPPDVIVCDIDMPGMDGVEFIRNVAERGLASAVVIASGLDSSVLAAVQDVSEGYGLQVLGAVEKPLTARRLSELLSLYRPARTAAATGSRPPSAADVIEALRAGAAEIVYQPIADLATGRIAAAEALVACSGLAEPTAVGRIAGEGEDALALADYVTERGAAELQGPGLMLWVALPRAAVGELAAADHLAAAVRTVGAEPDRAVIAIDAHMIQRLGSTELAALTRLRLKGFGVCLDEPHVTRGAGRVPLTAVRVGSEAIGEDDLEDELERWRRAGVNVIASGCDSGEQLDLMLRLGVGSIQGDVVGSACTSEQLDELARVWSPPASSR